MSTSDKQRYSLWDALSMRRRPNESKTYMELLLVPVVAVVVAGIILAALMMHILDYGGVTRSTVARNKIENTSGAECKVIDSDGLFEEQKYLLAALEEFAAVSGVYPCVYVTQNDNDTAQALYGESCGSENCFFVVYNVETDDFSAVAGQQASNVIDNEAYKIFCEYTEYYKDIADTDCEMLEYAFRATAKRIMKKTNLFNCVHSAYYVGVAVCLAIIVFFIVKAVNDIKYKRGCIINTYGGEI